MANQSATRATSYKQDMYYDFLNNYNIGIDTNAPTINFADPTSLVHDENYKTLKEISRKFRSRHEKYIRDFKMKKKNLDLRVFQ